MLTQDEFDLYELRIISSSFLDNSFKILKHREYKTRNMLF